ncbi:hypothetical protein HCY58_10855 [Acinetobacter radioresistens]|uniref:hypothetical protein n=1 Tax=Acinetobacter radioresistens TaxID=40216 RepID=UPI0020049959|nr:hypothetical protein [Acinetobacter radioresistens]MCK4087547.1 hypothetical protein [Acinetobacter radioresistens]
MSESSKFSKREWIHLIITLSIIQATIWFTSYVFAGSSNALGYISFAGTLISIILAVLAIGYTYGESQQQKNSSTTLGNQIDSLIKIKDKLEIQAEAIAEIQEIKNSLKSYSEKVDNHFSQTNSMLSRFNSEALTVEKIIREENTRSLNSNEYFDTESRERIFNEVFRENDLVILGLSIILVILYFEKKHEYKAMPFPYEFITDLGLENLSEDFMNIMFGVCFQQAVFFERIGLINKQLDQVDYVVINYFNLLINNKSESLGQQFDNTGKEILNLARKSIYFSETQKSN